MNITQTHKNPDINYLTLDNDNARKGFIDFITKLPFTQFAQSTPLINIYFKAKWIEIGRETSLYALQKGVIKIVLCVFIGGAHLFSFFAKSFTLNHDQLNDQLTLFAMGAIDFETCMAGLKKCREKYNEPYLCDPNIIKSCMEQFIVAPIDTVSIKSLLSELSKIARLPSIFINPKTAEILLGDRKWQNFNTMPLRSYPAIEHDLWSENIDFLFDIADFDTVKKHLSVHLLDGETPLSDSRIIVKLLKGLEKKFTFSQIKEILHQNGRGPFRIPEVFIAAFDWLKMRTPEEIVEILKMKDHFDIMPLQQLVNGKNDIDYEISRAYPLLARLDDQQLEEVLAENGVCNIDEDEAAHTNWTGPHGDPPVPNNQLNRVMNEIKDYKQQQQLSIVR